MYDIDAVKETFREYEPFNHSPFWNSFIMRYDTDVVTTPHYSNTIEISVYNNARGTVHIGNNHYTLSKKQAYIALPGVVHSMYYTKSDGYSAVLKINCEALSSIFNTEAYLAQNNLSYYDISPFISSFDEVHSIAETFLTSCSFNDTLSAFIQLLNILIKENKENDNYALNTYISNEFKAILDWTEDNLTQKISLDEVAAIAGYSKHYFCKKFKLITGMTYLSYLNHIRIYKACELLKSNESVNMVCSKCGFDDFSYFVQLFKKIMGITPKKYIQQFMES